MLLTPSAQKYSNRHMHTWSACVCQRDFFIHSLSAQISNQVHLSILSTAKNSEHWALHNVKFTLHTHTCTLHTVHTRYTQPVTFFDTFQMHSFCVCMCVCVWVSEQRAISGKSKRHRFCSFLYFFDCVRFSFFSHFHSFALFLNRTVCERTWFNICMPIAIQPNRISMCIYGTKVFAFE